MRRSAALLLILAAGLWGADPLLGTRLAEEEQLVGVVDGVNATFTLAHTPYPWISLKVFRNGIRLVRCRAGVPGGCDYALAGPLFNQVVFIPTQVPQVNDPPEVLVADYRW